MTETRLDKSQLILEALLRQVPFEGWTDRALMAAVNGLDMTPGAEAVYAPGGALGLLQLWSSNLDTEMVEALKARGLDNLRIRDKVTEAVWIRLNVLTGYEDAARRAVNRLALPDAATQGASQLWASADAIWTTIGDQSEDYNYYTKRAILSGVIGSSLLAWLGDETDDKIEARAFLERRIGNVMQFEKFKGQALGALEGLPPLPKPDELLGLFKKSPYRRRRPYQRRR